MFNSDTHAALDEAEDRKFLQMILDRLNGLIQHPGIRDDISRLIECRVTASSDSLSHKDIQCVLDGSWKVGLLGLLNGLIGCDDFDKGRLVAVCGDDNRLLRFEERLPTIYDVADKDALDAIVAAADEADKGK